MASNAALPLDKLSDESHHGIKLMDSPKDFLLPTSEACGNVCWSGWQFMMAQCSRLSDDDVDDACHNWIDGLNRFVALRRLARHNRKEA
jgi:hypothetical protein